MLYSTCTFSPEENEGTIAYLKEHYPEFHVVDALPEPAKQEAKGLSYDGFDTGKPEWINGDGELRKCIRLWPHKLDGEGHFITLLRKEPAEITASAEEVPKQGSSLSTKGKKSISEEARDFLRNIKIDIREEQLEVREEYLYLHPEGLPSLKGLRILRQGLLLGEMKKGRFEPSQALACALRTTEYDKVIRLSSEDPMVIKYLKCEAIEPEGNYEDGWYLICVEDYPLGWMKITKNNYKNKYLPGWRWV